MHRHLIAVLALLTGALPLAAQDSGLGNDTRVFTAPAEMTESDWSDPTEMQRAWDAAIVRVPTGDGQSTQVAIADLPALMTGRDTPLPTVIYLHGCSGIWSGTHTRLKFLADNGFLVIAPASFARLKYPRSCDVATHQSSLYRPTLRMRQNDAGQAIEKARDLPFVDTDRMVLMGLSEGGITTATFTPANDRQRVAARVIEGWTCRAGWGEYARINAPANEPVLALVASHDPWFQQDWNRGDCGPSMTRNPDSRSVVYSSGDLAYYHELLEFNEPRREALDFLRHHLDLPTPH
jgi:dienelactone hydrolase